MKKDVIVVVKQIDITYSNEDHIHDYIKLLRKVQHPCIIHFLGYSLSANILSILMEYMPMLSLYDSLHIRKQSYSMKDKLKMLIDTAKGVGFLHSFNPSIVHGDLKSRNLLLTNNHNVKLSGFGLNNHVSYVDSFSIPWAAPEVLEYNLRSCKSDVYSFGMILWEILNERIPFDDYYSIDSIVKDIIRGKRPTLDTVTNSQHSDLIKQCWLDVYDRTITFDDITLKIQSWIDNKEYD